MWLRKTMGHTNLGPTAFPTDKIAGLSASIQKRLKRASRGNWPSSALGNAPIWSVWEPQRESSQKFFGQERKHTLRGSKFYTKGIKSWTMQLFALNKKILLLLSLNFWMDVIMPFNYMLFTPLQDEMDISASNFVPLQLSARSLNLTKPAH